jgi:hypothetical protein
MDQSPFWADQSVPETPRVSLVICRGVKMGYIYSPVDSQWYPIIFQLILKYQEIITICIMVSLGIYPTLAIFGFSPSQDISTTPSKHDDVVWFITDYKSKLINCVDTSD